MSDTETIVEALSKTSKGCVVYDKTWNESSEQIEEMLNCSASVLVVNLNLSHISAVLDELEDEVADEDEDKPISKFLDYSDIQDPEDSDDGDHSFSVTSSPSYISSPTSVTKPTVSSPAQAPSERSPPHTGTRSVTHHLNPGRSTKRLPAPSKDALYSSTDCVTRCQQVNQLDQELEESQAKADSELQGWLLQQRNHLNSLPELYKLDPVELSERMLQFQQESNKQRESSKKLTERLELSHDQNYAKRISEKRSLLAEGESLLSNAVQHEERIVQLLSASTDVIEGLDEQTRDDAMLVPKLKKKLETHIAQKPINGKWLEKAQHIYSLVEKVCTNTKLEQKIEKLRSEKQKQEERKAAEARKAAEERKAAQERAAAVTASTSTAPPNTASASTAPPNTASTSTAPPNTATDSTSGSTSQTLSASTTNVSDTSHVPTAKGAGSGVTGGDISTGAAAGNTGAAGDTSTSAMATGGPPAYVGTGNIAGSSGNIAGGDYFQLKPGASPEDSIKSLLDALTPRDGVVMVPNYRWSMQLLAVTAQRTGAAAQDSGFSDLQLQVQTTILKLINTIGPCKAPELRRKIGDMATILQGSSLPSKYSQSKVTAKDHPAGITMAKDFLAQKVVKNATIIPEPYYLAAFLSALVEQIPDMQGFLLAHFYKECPSLAGQPQEPTKKSVDDQASMMQLFAAFLSTFSPAPPSSRPHPPRIMHAWTWLAMTLNQQPIPNVTAALLRTMLETAGHHLWGVYKDKFGTLLDLLLSTYLPRLKMLEAEMGEDNAGGHVARLELTLQGCANRQTIAMPRGALPQSFWTRLM